jgi:hypothetical protein
VNFFVGLRNVAAVAHETAVVHETAAVIFDG